MNSDAALARAVAEEAGTLLIAIRDGAEEAGKSLGDRGDREANALILRRLAAARPNDCILSEESFDDRSRCAAQRVWVVDPLDGTREYASGRDDWAVHIALAIDGCPVQGAVALPAMGRIFSTDRACPARPPIAPRPKLVVSRSRCPDLALQVAEALGAETLTMGSAGAKAMAVVDGRADIYLHEGGQYEWDNCAPAAVALAAGLHASRIDGTPLIYNREDPLLPDLLICRMGLADAALAAVRAVHG